MNVARRHTQELHDRAVWIDAPPPPPQPKSYREGMKRRKHVAPTIPNDLGIPPHMRGALQGAFKRLRSLARDEGDDDQSSDDDAAQGSDEEEVVAVGGDEFEPDVELSSEEDGDEGESDEEPAPVAAAVPKGKGKEKEKKAPKKKKRKQVFPPDPREHLATVDYKKRESSRSFFDDRNDASLFKDISVSEMSIAFAHEVMGPIYVQAAREEELQVGLFGFLDCQ